MSVFICPLLETTSAFTARGKKEGKTLKVSQAEPSLCQLSITTGAMVVAVLKLYFIGTALSVLAVLYGIADSFGGLMYAQDHHYVMDLDHQTQRQLSSGTHRRGSPVTKNVGS